MVLATRALFFSGSLEPESPPSLSLASAQHITRSSCPQKPQRSSLDSAAERANGSSDIGLGAQLLIPLNYSFVVPVEGQAQNNSALCLLKSYVKEVRPFGYPRRKIQLPNGSCGSLKYASTAPLYTTRVSNPQHLCHYQFVWPAHVLMPCSKVGLLVSLGPRLVPAGGLVPDTNRAIQQEAAVSSS